MVKIKSKRGLIVTIIVLAVVLLVVGAVVLTKKSSKPSADTSNQATTTKDTTTETDATDTDSSATNTTNPVVDSDTLTSVDVAPLGVTVFYSKGTPGFEFTVLKTADQTQYAQFTSSDLVGTKCTNDQGEFASIIKDPSSSEAQTTSQTVKVGTDTYGLSLASTGCTSNSDLLAQYQTGFKNGFASLKAL
jgi:type III secretory pathway component EscV